MAHIAVAVSGGADSLFALVSLREQGHKVMALHGLFLPASPNESPDASPTKSSPNVSPDAPTHTAPMSAPMPSPVPALQKLCDKLGIALHMLDLRQRFDAEVMAPFVQGYAAGQTPNPCALCNASIKFGALMDAAAALGADMLATGHYAALRPHALYAPQGGQVLAKGEDSSKDQSYFLALVPSDRLSRACFPLAGTHKSANIAYLEAHSIAVPLPRESQEICFVPADAYRPFVQQQAKARGITLPGAGPMLLEAEEMVLRQHLGLWQYTEGQRKGLGVAWKEPLYVKGKDHTRNALLLAPKGELALRGCEAVRVNMLVPWEYWPEEVWARVRYRQQETRASVELVSRPGGQGGQEEQVLRVHFHQPQAPTARGQIVAIYDAQGCVLAGGIIAETF